MVAVRKMEEPRSPQPAPVQPGTDTWLGLQRSRLQGAASAMAPDGCAVGMASATVRSTCSTGMSWPLPCLGGGDEIGGVLKGELPLDTRHEL